MYSEYSCVLNRFFLMFEIGTCHETRRNLQLADVKSLCPEKKASYGDIIEINILSPIKTYL